LKVLLFPNLSATSYAIGDIRNWIQDVSEVCRQSKGIIEPFLALDADVGETIQSLNIPIKHQKVSPSALLEQLNTIKNKIFPFDGIFVKGRNKFLESVAAKLNVFLLTFAKTPYPLDVWLLHSPWHKKLQDKFKSNQWDNPTSSFHEVIPEIPSYDTYYLRHNPYTGEHSKRLYDPNKKKILVPLYYYYRSFISETYPRRFLKWLEKMTSEKEELTFFLLPMSERSDRLQTHFQDSKEGVFWLEKQDGRDQALSLIDKADCVLALDNAGALLPLLLNKPVCRDPKIAIELVSQLPKITDWINGRIAEDQFRDQREKLLHHIFAHVVVPKQWRSLLRFKKAYSTNNALMLTEPRSWSICQQTVFGNDKVHKIVNNQWIRKFKKLQRDPYTFFDDSSSPFLKPLRYFFRPPHYYAQKPNIRVHLNSSLLEGSEVQPAQVRLIRSYRDPCQVPQYNSQSLSNTNSDLGQGVPVKPEPVNS
jgi:hypothetical protein